MSRHGFLKPVAIALFTSITLAGCGGGGGGSDDNTSNPPNGGGGGGSTGPTYTAGVYENADNFAGRCENPRNYNDINGNPYNDRQGSILYENHFLRSYSNDTYLWYNELPDLDPGNYNDPIAYFELLKTNAVTASGAPKDQFHFTYNTDDYEKLSQAGVSVSYGIDWALLQSAPPRKLYIRTIEPGSPADAPEANLTRGVKILQIDGVDVEYGNDVDTLNAGLFPSAIGESHTFTVQDVGSNTTRDVTLSAIEVEYDPVPIVDVFNTASGKVGYMLFNDHNFVSEDRLFDSVTQLRDDNVTDLVLDLRYNGGGLLYIASELAYMIAGSAATDGRVFNEVRFNDKYPNINPVTGQRLESTPFYNGISSNSDKYPGGTRLPSLDLDRVFILATSATCSASEAIINGLRGVDVEVILIGSTTCGKPYGFYPTDNCGTTYFTVQFDGVNDKGQGGYSDGFTPMNEPSAPGILQNGCYVIDDLSTPLGDINDPMVAAALNYRIDGSCPVVTQVASFGVQPFRGSVSGAQTVSNGGFGSTADMISQMINYTDPHKKAD